jgi:hypothetical protein
LESWIAPTSFSAARDLLGGEPVEVGGGPHPADVHEQAHLLLAEPVDVHRADVVLEQLPPAAGAIAVRALREHRILGLDGRRVAYRAALRRLRCPRPALALGDVRRGREHLRDHVTCPQHDHVLPLADVLAPQILLVVERRELHGDAAHVHRLEHRVRMKVAELAGVPADSLQLRHRRRRRELPGDRPPWLAPDRAEPAL